MNKEICTHCEEREVMEGVGERCLECWQEYMKPDDIEEIKQRLIKEGHMMDGSKYCGQC